LLKLESIEGYAWYKKLKDEISKNKDIEKLISLKKISKISPHLSKELLLEAKIRRLQSQLKEVRSIKEEERIYREIDKMKMMAALEKLHEKSEWDYMIRTTDWKFKDSYRNLTNIGDFVKRKIKKISEKVQKSLPPSIQSLNATVSSKEITTWAYAHSEKNVRKPKELIIRRKFLKRPIAKWRI
jgi:hypothetical protein